jgi:hypothetical protein
MPLWEQYRKLPRYGKIAFWLVLGSQVPLLYLVFNTFFLNFSVDAVPYQHLHMMDRVMMGVPVYSPLATDHAAVTYTPLYWWVNGFLFRVLGPSFLLPRLISILSSLVLAVALFLFVYENTEGDPVLSMAAPALVLLTSAMQGFDPWAWYINVNAFHVALTVLGFFVLRRSGGLVRVVVGAALLSASVLAKQTGLAYVVAAAVFLFIRNRKEAVVFAVVLVAILGGVFKYLNASTNGEFFRQIVSANQGPPWLFSRLIDEVLLSSFAAICGVFLFATVAHAVAESGPGWWARFMRAEYFLCASGIGVAVIAHPKHGSGATQDIVAIAGLAVCGCIGLYELCKRMEQPMAGRVRTWMPVLQVAIGLTLTLPSLPYIRIDRHDREKNEAISRVFYSGRTCLFGVPYIQKIYGQPLGGYPDDEPSKWVDGRLALGNIPAHLSEPFKKQVYDYVIVGPYFDPEHPVVKAILENYKNVVQQIPRHPNGGRGGSLRNEMYVLQANRIAEGRNDLLR